MTKGSIEPRRVWENQLANINAELVRVNALITIDGQTFVDPNLAGANLVDIYTRHVSVGYAKGWL